jgi:putative ABC transport system permease protein
VWSITLRDLQFRKRRFAIGALGTALSFAMALTLSGISEGFRAEARRTITSVGADRWLMPEGSAGPFTAFATIPVGVIDEWADLPGVERADPLVIVRQAVDDAGDLSDVTVIGYRRGGLGAPDPREGEIPASPGDAVADATLGLDVGETFLMAGREFRVSGVAEGMTFAAGVPNLYLDLADAQDIAFGGASLATTGVTRGVPERAPAGFTVLTNEQGITDGLRPLAKGIESIDTSTIFLWVVAAVIIGAVVYLTTLERSRDFAVLKAIGASSTDLFVGLAIQAVLVALVAAAAAAAVGFLLIPAFPLPVEIPTRSFVWLPIVAVVVGLAASLVGLRRTIAVDPALAFGSV